MKYIKIEEFNKASDEVQYKILDWWTPSDGDLMYNLETKEREVFEASYMDIDCVHSYCIPLLTVGQLIGFIEKITDSKMDIMYSYINYRYEIYLNRNYEQFVTICSFKIKSDSLLQVLWEVATKVINNESI